MSKRPPITRRQWIALALCWAAILAGIAAAVHGFMVEEGFGYFVVVMGVMMLVVVVILVREKLLRDDPR